MVKHFMYIHEWIELFAKTNNVELSKLYWFKKLYTELNRRHQDWIDDPMWYAEYPKCKVIQLTEFHNFNNSISDFIYDRSTEMVIVNFKKLLITKSHESLVAELASVWYDDEDYLEELAELYSKHHGFFLSSVSHRNLIYVGKDFKLSNEEKHAFDNYTFCYEL